MFNLRFNANTAFLLFVLIVNLYRYINITWFFTHFWPILNLKWSQISNFFMIKQWLRPLGGTWLVIEHAIIFCLSNWLVVYAYLPYKLGWNRVLGTFLHFYYFCYHLYLEWTWRWMAIIIITLRQDLQQPISLRRAQRLAGSTNIYLSISLSLALSLSLFLPFASHCWCQTGETST